jgi:hypothetical protein
MSHTMYLLALNSLIACFMIASSYGIACSWAIMKKIDRVEEAEPPAEEPVEPEEELDEEKLKRSEILTNYLEMLLNYANENPESTVGEFLSLHPVPIELSEEEHVSPLKKHIALLERFNDELQEANSMWLDYANDIMAQKKDIAHDRETIKTMMYTSLTCLFIMVASYAMVIYAHILVR